jgi:hypothetical protein
MNGEEEAGSGRMLFDESHMKHYSFNSMSFVKVAHQADATAAVSGS